MGDRNEADHEDGADHEGADHQDAGHADGAGHTHGADHEGAAARAALPEAVLSALRRPPGSLVAVVATVDADGSPRTAAFGALRAPAADHLRFGCRRTHDTFANIVRDGRVMVALYAAPDVAVGIRGRARVLRESLQAMPSNALVEIDVAAVKDDAVPGLPVASGITYTLPAELVAVLDAVNAELDAGEDLGRPAAGDDLGRPAAGEDAGRPAADRDG